MPMDIESTYFVAFAMPVIAAALGLCLAGQREGPDDRSLTWLVVSNIAFLAACAGLFLRPLLSFEASAVIVTGGAVFGLAAGYLSLLAACFGPDRRKPVLLLAAGVVALQAVLAMLADGAEVLMLSSSIINGPICIAAGIGIWRRIKPSGPTISALLALPFLIIGLTYLARIGPLMNAPGGATVEITTGALIILLTVTSMSWVSGIALLRTNRLSGRLERLARDANAARDAKAAFLRNMSHEIRTPLNGILGLSELMRLSAAGPLAEPYREHAELINRSGQRLLRLLVDILDLSAVEAGKLPIEEGEATPQEIIAKALAPHRDEAESRGISINMPAAVQIAALPRLRCDPRRLTQALENIIDNAIKFTPTGGRIDIECSADGWFGAVLRVSDTGPGIPPEDRDVALRLFGRTALANRSASEGAGLGLPLSHAIMLAHEGDLIIETAAGVGTAVTLRLPGERVVGSPLHDNLSDSEHHAIAI